MMQYVIYTDENNKEVTVEYTAEMRAESRNEEKIFPSDIDTPSTIEGCGYRFSRGGWFSYADFTPSKMAQENVGKKGA